MCIKDATISKNETDRRKTHPRSAPTRIWPLHLNRQFYFDTVNMIIIIEYLLNLIIVMSLVKLIFCNDISRSISYFFLVILYFYGRGNGWLWCAPFGFMWQKMTTVLYQSFGQLFKIQFFFRCFAKTANKFT